MSSNNRRKPNKSCIKIKWLFLIGAVLLVTFTSVNSLENKISPRVIEELESKGNSRVIIKYEINPKLSSLGLNTKISKFKRTYRPKKIDRFELNKLKKDFNVKEIHYDYKYETLLTESVPLINASMLHNLITLEGRELKGNGQSVCVVDTGINYNHNALGNGWGNKIIAGWRFLENGNVSINCTGNNSACFDDNGHGTHVAGIISSNGSLKGIAPETKIVVVKVLDANGEGYSLDISKGIEWCTNQSANYNISTISLSIGTRDYHSSSFCDNNPSFIYLRNAINYATSKNLTVIVATGNEGNYTAISAPACIENSTRVTASDKNDNMWLGANRGGEFKDIITAPGYIINSTNSSGEYETKYGTSMAVPHVSGIISLLKQYSTEEENRNLLPNQIFNILNSTGKKIPDSNSGKNYSRVDAYSALIETDNKSPIINITYPKDNQIYKIGNFSLNFTIQEINLNTDSCKYSINNNSNTSITNCSIAFFNLSTPGEYNLTLYVSDKSDNSNSLTIYFNVSSSPIIRLIYPPNSSAFEPGTKLNFTITSPSNLSEVSFYGTKTGNMTNNDNVSWYINTSNWSTGVYNITIYVNTSPGGCSSNSSYIFYLDHSPNISFWSWYFNESYMSNSSNISYKNVTAFENGTIEFYANATDNDFFSNLTYYWYLDRTFQSNQTCWNYSISTNDSGKHNISLTVSDGKLNSTKIWNFTVIDPWPPYFNLEDKTLDEGETLTYDVDASDEDNDVLTYYDNSSEFDINSTTGLIIWSSSNSGNYNFLITVSDGYSNVSRKFSVEVNKVSEEHHFSPSGGGSSTILEDTDSSIENSKTYVIGKVSPDEKKEIDLKEEELDVYKLNLESKNEYSNVEIELNHHNSKPEDISSASENTYRYLSITSNYEDIVAEIKFRVNKSWIESKNIDINKIYLSRLIDDSWSNLNTERFGETKNYIYYSAETPGFSYFAIIGEEKIIEETPKINNSLEKSNEEIIIKKNIEEYKEEIAEEKPKGVKTPIIINNSSLIVIIFIVFLTVFLYIQRREQ